MPMELLIELIKLVTALATLAALLRRNHPTIADDDTEKEEGR